MSTDAPGCRLCHSNDVTLWGRKPGRVCRDVVFDHWRCRSCDFRFVEPVTGPEIYDDAYYAGRGADPLVAYEQEYRDYASTPRVHEFAGLVNAVEKHLRSGDDAVAVTWLDYGCGAGGLLKFLRDRGTVRVGARPRPVRLMGSDVGSYADRLRERDGFDILSAEALARLADGSCDVITLVEVVEHVAHPLPLLRECRRLLRPGGLLLLTTGNLASPLARLQGVGFAYCVPEIHVSLWTPRALEHAYALAGLSPLRVHNRQGLRFKVAKNLARVPAPRVLGPMLMSLPSLAAFDWLFGVSQMPMASRP